MITVSLNVGGGVRLIKPAKLCMCMQTHYKHDEVGCTALDVRGHGSHTAEPLGQRRYENLITHVITAHFKVVLYNKRNTLNC